MNKVLSVFLSSFMMVSALALTVGAVQATVNPEEAIAIEATDFSADMISAEDKPGDAMDWSLRSNVVKVINYFLTFLGLVAVAFIVYAGVILVTDAGGGEGVDKAKQIILYAGAGIIIILLSYSIVNVFVGVKNT